PVPASPVAESVAAVPPGTATQAPPVPPAPPTARDHALDARLTRVEAALEAVMDELRALRGVPETVAPASPAVEAPPSPPAEPPRAAAVVPREETGPSPVGRRAGEVRGPALGVRNA